MLFFVKKSSFMSEIEKTEQNKVPIESEKLKQLITEVKEGGEAKKKLQSIIEGIGFLLGNSEEAISARQLLMLMPTMDESQLKSVASPRILKILTDLGEIFKEQLNGKA
jgi:hypothetical protein